MKSRIILLGYLLLLAAAFMAGCLIANRIFHWIALREAEAVCTPGTIHDDGKMIWCFTYKDAGQDE